MSFHEVVHVSRPDVTAGIGDVFRMANERGFLGIVLIANLPDQFLDDIFNGDKPGGSAVFIEDDGDMKPSALKLAQQA